MQITGESLFPSFFPPWVIEFALREGAIIVSLNYLILPVSTGFEIMDNVSHFWAWLHESLGSVVAPVSEGKVEVDESKKLVMGHSAGEDARSIPT